MSTTPYSTNTNQFTMMSGRKAAAVTTSDSTLIDPPTRALWVGTGGNVAVIMADDGSAVTFKNVPSGSRLDYCVSKVMSTNTTATDIVAIY